MYREDGEPIHYCEQLNSKNFSKGEPPKFKRVDHVFKLLDPDLYDFSKAIPPNESLSVPVYLMPSLAEFNVSDVETCVLNPESSIHKSLYDIPKDYFWLTTVNPKAVKIDIIGYELMSKDQMEKKRTESFKLFE